MRGSARRGPAASTSLPLAVLAALASACAQPGGAPGAPVVTPLEVPAGAGAAQPSAAVWGDRAMVSWIEPVDDEHALRFAAWDGAAWTEPATVAQGADWFVNWADFPSMLALDDRTLVAHWLQRSGPGTYAYDVMLTRSADAGATWSRPVRPHHDATQTEHGFVTLFPHGDDAGIVWLDGRAFAGEDATREMMVRFTSWPSGAAPAPDLALDERACDCCQTSVAVGSAGPIVVYRDRSPDEIRDIAMVRFVDGSWTPPRIVHDDGWHITGCPVNGPQAGAHGSHVAIAWFTQAADTPRVQVVQSTDGGASFGGPVRVDDGQPLGRVDVLVTANGDALVTWLERVGDIAEIRTRVVRGGVAGPAALVAPTAASRPAGFPRMARRGDDVIVVWPDPRGAGAVRAATVALPARHE